MFINKTKGDSNLDLANGRSLEYYLDLTKDYKHDFTFTIKDIDGFKVVDDGEFLYGSKAKMADFFISQVKEDAMVYVCPRTGYAPFSLCYLAKKYNKKLYLVMPASKEASEHQRTAIEYGGIPIFLRIPAMPTANIWAKQFAEKIGAKYLPFGLKHEMVVAGGVRIFYDNFKNMDIQTMWSVMSTGVLSRTLQIALPNTKFHAVAVARNIQDGELGRAKFYTHSKPFLKEAKIIPPFDCIRTYDAKGWELLKENGNPGDWFWNVAANMPKPNLKVEDVDSDRVWGDHRDMKQYIK
jgi:hypothetical protein